MEPSVRLWWRKPTPNDAHEAGACPASTVAAVEPTLSHAQVLHMKEKDVSATAELLRRGDGDALESKL
ncbi:hypothetical protein RHSIM_Rhsim02G0077600 [Rhododendron simsii]|uniref:Uncharacterized protein n=1 Tax=Rhododendron simsii TaxID=118357 RepID=A0A834HIZ8_RHOSS|nr:hypothetical protein RHSIM_Rhsim02G0077600 [Rhododendron simsii]